MSNQSDTRTVTSLRTGTKVALITALCFLAVAAYFFMTPTNFLGKDGGIFGCGSPMSPNDSALGKGQCSMLEKVALNRALLFLALAVITALLGFLLFGSDKSAQSRLERRPLEDEEDDRDSGSFRDAMHVMPRYPRVLSLIIAWCPVQLGVAAVSVLGPLVAQNAWGGVTHWAAVATAMAAGGLVGAFVAAWVDTRWNWLTTLVALTVCGSADLMVLASTTSVWLIATMFALTSVVMGVAGVLFDTVVQRSVPDRVLARVGSVEQTLIGGMVPLGLVVSLPLARLVGDVAFLWGLVVLTLTVGSVAGGFVAYRYGLADGPEGAAEAEEDDRIDEEPLSGSVAVDPAPMRTTKGGTR